MTKRNRRTARKMVLPLLAVGLMTLMMYIGRPQTPTPSSHPAPGAAARPAHLHQR